MKPVEKTEPPIPAEPPPSRLGAIRQRAVGAATRVVRKGVRAAATVTEEGLRSARAGLFVASHLIDGHVIPALDAGEGIVRDVEAAGLEAVDGRTAEPLRRLGVKAKSGSAYAKLVDTVGRDLLGSARFAGETTLADNGVYRLQYLPPAEGVPRSDVAIFFVGGFIPYGDRLFRFLPEANLFDRYLERGLPVYLMEVSGDGSAPKSLENVTAEQVVDWIDAFAGIAFTHNGERRLSAQGYCGSAIHLLSWLSALPGSAGEKIATATLYAPPLDARRCLLAEPVSLIPRSLMWATLRRSELFGGRYHGLELWAGLDVSLRNVFRKTSAGRFATGWRKPELAGQRDANGLSVKRRFELADAYWTSIDNARRHSMPVALVRQAMHLHERGVDADGHLGFSYRGRPVGLRALATESRIRVCAFFGGRDKLVPPEAGRPLKVFLGDRYREVFHPNAAHVGYVCRPDQWRTGGPDAFDPNPLDVILEEYARA